MKFAENSILEALTIYLTERDMGISTLNGNDNTTTTNTNTTTNTATNTNTNTNITITTITITTIPKVKSNRFH